MVAERRSWINDAQIGTLDSDLAQLLLLLFLFLALFLTDIVIMADMADSGNDILYGFLTFTMIIFTVEILANWICRPGYPLYVFLTGCPCISQLRRRLFTFVVALMQLILLLNGHPWNTIPPGRDWMDWSKL